MDGRTLDQGPLQYMGSWDRSMGHRGSQNTEKRNAAANRLIVISLERTIAGADTMAAESDGCAADRVTHAALDTIFHIAVRFTVLKQMTKKKSE
jgi:hypothetical protein